MNDSTRESLDIHHLLATFNFFELLIFVFIVIVTFD